MSPCAYAQVEVGPYLLESHQGQVEGLEAALRIKGPNPTSVTPYMIGVAGVGIAQGWRASDVPYTFTSEIGAGLEWQILPHASITADFRVIHHSNGMSFFGDGTRQFFGLTKATKNEGYENAGVFVGIVYDW